MPDRSASIVRDLAHVIAEQRPTEVAVEKVFVNINPNSTLLLGQARGAAIAAAVLAGLPVAEYTALQVKQAVVGAGRALKPQVQEMVRRLLALPGIPAADAADALAARSATRMHRQVSARSRERLSRARADACCHLTDAGVSAPRRLLESHAIIPRVRAS